jgi:hypothetical protein
MQSGSITFQSCHQGDATGAFDGSGSFFVRISRNVTGDFA